MSLLLVAIASSLISQPEFVEQNGQVIGSIEGQEVFVYHIEPVDRPDATDATYRRSGFVHPLRTLTGTVVTDDFAPDHPHQNGLFSTHVNVTFEGRRVDFWNQHKGLGTFRHAKLVGMTSSSDSASFSVVIEHVDKTAPDGPKVAITEDRTYTLSRAGEFVIVDVEATQSCETASPVILNQYKYGGAAVRGARHWTKSSGADFVTDAGLDRIDGNHTKATWFQLFGPATPESVEFASIASIAHPTNFRFPQPVRLHPEMPYGVFAPCVIGTFKITPDTPYRMQYRYIIADGRPNAEAINQIAEDFAAQ